VHDRPTVGGYYSRIWDLDGLPQWSLERIAEGAHANVPGFDGLLQDVLDAWEVREVLVAPTALPWMADTLDKRPWMLPVERDQGWTLYRVPLRPQAESEGLDARLLHWIGDETPGVEVAVFLALHHRDPAGPQVQWNPAPQDLEAQRAWWRDWGTRKGLMTVPSEQR
jgi:hypothetical protein